MSSSEPILGFALYFFGCASAADSDLGTYAFKLESARDASFVCMDAPMDVKPC